MAIQYSVATRNAKLDAVETAGGTTVALEIRTGAVPANCAAAGSGTVLSTILLPTDWMSAPSSGLKSLLGTWQDTSAAAAGTAAHFRMYTSQATKDNTTCFMQGTVTATGGGGDLILDNAVIAIGQTVTVTQFDITAGNA